MRYLPIQLSVRDRPVLVVGGGEVATRKASVLARAGACLRVVSPEVEPGMSALIAAGAGHELSQRGFEAGDVEGMTVVVAATDEAEVNRAVSEAARAAGVPVNVVDSPALCTFIMPALVDRDPIVVAVSSAGDAPVLARSVRARFEAQLPSRLGELARLMGRYRPMVKARFDTLVARRAFWEALIEGPVAEQVFSGQLEQAEASLKRMLSDDRDAPRVVYLVGLGPGAPEQITLQAQRCLQLAERIVHAQDVPSAVLDQARRDAPRSPLSCDIAAPALTAQLLGLVRESDRICWARRGALGQREREVAAQLEEAGYQVVLAPGLAAD